jgi:MSHA biogenesis protein MshK
MAAYLSKVWKHVRIATGLVLMFFVMGNLACAQTLPDPTRPPVLPGANAEPPAGGPVGPELQSVLISPTRRVAIINGQSVKLGGKFGESQVVKISEGEVVLRTGQDVQVLKLFPDVQKRVSSGRAGKSGSQQ